MSILTMEQLPARLLSAHFSIIFSLKSERSFAKSLKFPQYKNMLFSAFKTMNLTMEADANAEAKTWPLRYKKKELQKKSNTD